MDLRREKNMMIYIVGHQVLWHLSWCWENKRVGNIKLRVLMFGLWGLLCFIFVKEGIRLGDTIRGICTGILKQELSNLRKYRIFN